MAHVLFVQSPGLWVELQGVACLSAYLKHHGHSCDICIATDRSYLERRLREQPPTLVAFSCVTGNQKWALATAREIHEVLGLAIPTVMGGPHATIFPEVVTDPHLDFVVRGEGEGALLDLVEAVAAGRDATRIPNVWTVVDGEVVKNEVRPLVRDLGTLPLPDRELYRRYEFFRWDPVKTFFTNRGCPYACTFCFYNQINQLYRGKGPVVRDRPPAAVIEEIRGVLRLQPLEVVYFESDTFNVNRKWLYEFLEVYGRELGIPFECNVRVDLVDEEQVRRLRAAGCIVVSFGLETGDEDLRAQLLGKRTTDVHVREAAKLFRRHGIQMKTSNMLGLPGETFEQAWKTLELNIEIGALHPRVGLFQPYPGLEVTRRAQAAGCIQPGGLDRIGDSLRSTVMRHPDLDRIVNLQKLFYLAMRIPALKPLVRQLTRLPRNRLFDTFFLLTHSYQTYTLLNLPLATFVRYALQHRRYQA